MPGFGSLDHQQAAALYGAFLEDYDLRFRNLPAPFSAAFCVRHPRSEEERRARRVFFGGLSLPWIQEPLYQGRTAQDIGQAMAYSIRHQLDNGASSVLVLGSDLPHLPLGVLEQSQALLEEHALVLGNDGGGCYLVGANEPAEVLEQGDISWSQGDDLEAIKEKQRKRSLTVGILPEIIEDIDSPAALGRLIDTIRSQDNIRRRLPTTCQTLSKLGFNLAVS